MGERRIVGHEEEPEPKQQRMQLEVTENPTVHRGAADQITSIVIKGKARFKGEVTVKARGDLATAYWSVTPGMKLSIVASEAEEKTYVAQEIEVA